MGFGGSVSAMISSLKNNKRSRTSTFEKLKKYEKSTYKKELIEKKATPQQLKEIRERLQKENKRRRIKTIAVMVIFAIVLVALLLLFNVAKF